MDTEKSLTEKLTEMIEKEKNRFAEKEGNLSDFFTKFSKLGVLSKTNYSLPLKDTIGKTFNEQIQFKKKLF